MACKRDAIRDTCGRLRKLLGRVKPNGMLAIFQEVGTIECDALATNSDELQAVEQKLEGLVRRLIDQGIITEERWEEFFGDRDQ